MKIITMHPPWALFIPLRWKTIETRNHKRFQNLLGHTIGIHVSQHWDKDWYRLASPYLSERQLKKIGILKTENRIPFGKIICTAYVYNFRLLFKSDSKDSLIDCDYEGKGIEKYGLLLMNVRELKQPIPAKGHQGIWNIEDSKIMEAL